MHYGCDMTLNCDIQFLYGETPGTFKHLRSEGIASLPCGCRALQFYHLFVPRLVSKEQREDEIHMKFPRVVFLAQLYVHFSRLWDCSWRLLKI